MKKNILVMSLAMTVFLTTGVFAGFFGLTGNVIEPGDNDFCSELNPCSDREGDCDSHAGWPGTDVVDCVDGTVCQRNVGNKGYGFAWYTDVCVAVGPSTPENVEAEPLSQSEIKVTWYAVEGADRYSVYRGTGVFIESASGLEYTESGLNPSVNRCYIIKSVNNDGVSSSSERVCATTLGRLGLDAPNNFKVDGGNNLLTLSWDSVEGATEYEIYRGRVVPLTSDYVDTETSNSYVVTGLSDVELKCYNIRAKNANNQLSRWTGIQCGTTSGTSVPAGNTGTMTLAQCQSKLDGISALLSS